MNQPPYSFANLPAPSPYPAPPPMVPPAAPAAAPQVPTLSAGPAPPPPPPLPASSPYGGVASSAAAGGLTAAPLPETITDTVDASESSGGGLGSSAANAMAGFGKSMQSNAQAGQQAAFNAVFHSTPITVGSPSAAIQPISMSDRRAKTQVRPATEGLRAFLDSWRQR